MTEPHSSLRLSYRQLLAEHLANPTESSLQQAYELGRAMLTERCGVLDAIRFHFEAAAETAGAAENPAALEEFISEVLSPFEVARRGFHLAWDQLQELNAALAERNEALASSNSQLQAEIAERRRAEEALRESKDNLVKLLAQAREMEDNLRDLSARVLTAQEEERKRISRDLHDEIAQALTAVNVSVNILKQHTAADPALGRKVAEAESLLQHSLDMVHAFARSLRPSMLDHLGVHSALRALVAEVTGRTKLAIELDTHPDLERMGGQRGEVVFRVAQEALNNCLKHAHASLVQIHFDSDDTHLTMDVVDDGRGIPADKLRNAGSRLGLLGMKERARLVDGTISIESVVGRGTRIRLQVPFEAPITHPAQHEENICTAC